MRSLSKEFLATIPVVAMVFVLFAPLTPLTVVVGITD